MTTEKHSVDLNRRMLILLKRLKVNILGIHDTMEDKTMNRVQLLSLSMLLLAGSVAFAAEHHDDVVVGGNDQQQRLPLNPLPAAPGYCAQAKTYLANKAAATVKLVWGDRNAYSRTVEAALVVGGVAAVIHYWPWANKKAKALKAQGDKGLQYLKDSSKQSKIIGVTAGALTLEAIAEYKGWGLSKLVKAGLKKAHLIKA